jgi:hypothetical protein
VSTTRPSDTSRDSYTREDVVEKDRRQSVFPIELVRRQQWKPEAWQGGVGRSDQCEPPGSEGTTKFGKTNEGKKSALHVRNNTVGDAVAHQLGNRTPSMMWITPFETSTGFHDLVTVDRNRSES